MTGVQGTKMYRKEIHLVLNVRPPDRQPFRATATVYEAFADDSVRQGQTVLVKYDPNNTSIVAVETDSFRKICDDVAMEDVLAAERREQASSAKLAHLDERTKRR